MSAKYKNQKLILKKKTTLKCVFKRNCEAANKCVWFSSGVRGAHFG